MGRLAQLKLSHSEVDKQNPLAYLNRHLQSTITKRQRRRLWSYRKEIKVRFWDFFLSVILWIPSKYKKWLYNKAQNHPGRNLNRILLGS